MITKTAGQESPGKEYGLLSFAERAIFSQLSAEEPPYSQRAQMLLALDEGATQAEAGSQAGLSIGQVRYWLVRFRRARLEIFPEELLNKAQQAGAVSLESSAIQAASPEAQEFAAPGIEEEAPQEILAEEEIIEPVDAATAESEDQPQAKKKPTQKASKKSKKKASKKPKQKVSKKSKKKPKKAKKAKKPEKKTKKNKTQKTKAKKSKSGKKKRKNN